MDLPRLLTTWFQSSEGWPSPCPTVTWLHFRRLATRLHLQLFTASHGHVIAFYDGFTKSQHLLLVFSRINPLQTVGLLNDHGSCCKKIIIIIIKLGRHMADLIYIFYKLWLWWTGSITVVTQGIPVTFSDAVLAPVLVRHHQEAEPLSRA